MNTKALSKTLTRLYKSYFYKVAAKELKRLADINYGRIVARQLRTMELDKKGMLRRAGLTTYSPMRSTVGGTLLFVGGAAAGALIGLSLAPMRGEDFRQQVKTRAVRLRSEYGETQAPAQA